MKKENQEPKKLKEGNEVFYIVSEKQMDRTKVESIDKKQGYALLANKVKITRTLDVNGSYQRLDGKPGFAYPINEDTEEKFQAIKASCSLIRSIGALEKLIRDTKLEDSAKMLIELDKKITKLINRYKI